MKHEPYEYDDSYRMNFIARGSMSIKSSSLTFRNSFIITDDGGTFVDLPVLVFGRRRWSFLGKDQAFQADEGRLKQKRSQKGKENGDGKMADKQVDLDNDDNEFFAFPTASC